MKIYFAYLVASFAMAICTYFAVLFEDRFNIMYFIFVMFGAMGFNITIGLLLGLFLRYYVFSKLWHYIVGGLALSGFPVLVMIELGKGANDVVNIVICCLIGASIFWLVSRPDQAHDFTPAQ